MGKLGKMAKTKAVGPFLNKNRQDSYVPSTEKRKEEIFVRKSQKDHVFVL